MKTINRSVFNKWLASMPPNDSLIILMKASNLGASVLQKLVMGSYKSEIKQHTRIAIAKAVGVDESKLWVEA